MERTMTTTISVLGLGLMGRPMARVLLAAGYDVRGWNRSPLADELAGDIPRCRDLADAAQAEVCILMLSDSPAVDAVLGELESHLVPGRLVIDMGTSDPAHSRMHAERLERKRIDWVDAPVSGGTVGAAAGTLAIMAGGSAAAFARARPILETLGGNVVHVGGPGAGHVAKLVNQVIVALTIEAVAEALTLAERSGLDPHLIQQALVGGFADSPILRLQGTRMINRDYAPGGKAVFQLKDLRMALALAESVGAALPHLESITARFAALVAQGDGDLDHAAIHKLLWP